VKENSDREALERVVLERQEPNLELIPREIKTRLDSWQWGKMGWTSPANLIITASWRKVFYPLEDCCKIWARDSRDTAINGSYSIRTADETVTVPIFAKYDLCTGFCSSNSGMQGSRAIEKSRGNGRIDRNLRLEQRTVFDAQLFSHILNDINELSETESLEVLKYLVKIAYSAKESRTKNDNVLLSNPPRIDLLAFASRVQDPEFVKCVAAACLALLFENHGLKLEGIQDHKTSADGRAVKAGDLTLTRNGEAVVAIEVKDKSRKLDWQNINGVRAISKHFPKLEGFYFVLESRSGERDLLVSDLAFESSHNQGIPSIVSFISLPDLLGLAIPINGYDQVIRKTAHFVTKAPSIKPATKSAWTQLS
jgi:hypothetical protein